MINNTERGFSLSLSLIFHLDWRKRIERVNKEWQKYSNNTVIISTRKTSLKSTRRKQNISPIDSRRSEYDTATDQYCKTIGFLEPSYVIKKFLDSQHIDHLTRYLEELHREKLANVDHTTLLLNCYTKHPDRIGRLAQFIGLNENLLSSTDTELAFDVDIAIDVCRQAGSFVCERLVSFSLI